MFDWEVFLGVIINEQEMQLAVIMRGTLQAPYIVSQLHRNETSTWLSVELGEFCAI